MTGIIFHELFIGSQRRIKEQKEFRFRSKGFPKNA